MMEQQPDIEQEQAAAPVDQAPSVGTALREARERMGLSLDDVVNRLKFAPRQIKALEADDFSQLPEAAFVRGFVRSYARLVQLDEAPLLAALPGQEQNVPPADARAAEVPFPDVYAQRRPNIVWLAAALLVALVLGVFAWWHDRVPSAPQKQLQSQQIELTEAVPASAVAAVSDVVPAAPAASAVAPVAAVPVASAVAAAAPRPKKAHSTAGPIRLAFDEESWVEIKDKDGNVLLSQVNPAGSEQYVDGNPPFALVIGRAKGVRLYYKGKQIDLAPSTHVAVAHLTLE